MFDIQHSWVCFLHEIYKSWCDLFRLLRSVRCTDWHHFWVRNAFYERIPLQRKRRSRLSWLFSVKLISTAIRSTSTPLKNLKLRYNLGLLLIFIWSCSRCIFLYTMLHRGQRYSVFWSSWLALFRLNRLKSIFHIYDRRILLVRVYQLNHQF